MSAPPYHRQHPLAMLRYIRRYLWLLLLPLGHGLQLWLQGSRPPAALLLPLLVFPLWGWLQHTYAVTDDSLCIRRGLLLRRHTRIPLCHITTLTVERPWHLRLLRAARVRVDTDAGSAYRADRWLIVSRRAATAFLSTPTEKPTVLCHPPMTYTLLFSLLASNPLSGALLPATALYRIGQLLGEGVQRALLDNLEAAAALVTLIPRTAAMIALAVAAGWAVGVLRSLLRYLPFRVARYGNTLHVCTGSLTRRDHLCAVEAIHFIDYRQSLLTRLMRLHTVFIHCIGYGKGNHAMAVLLPACPVACSASMLQRLLPAYQPQPPTLRPRRWAIWRYAYPPLLAGALLLPAARALARLLPQWQELLTTLAIFAAIPCVWLLAVRIVDHRTAGATCADGCFTLRYARLFTFHTVAVPCDRVVATALRQSPFQRLTHSCDLMLYTHDEKRLCHRIKSVPLSQAATLLAGKE